MKYSDLLHNLGFDRDPFATTNADEEELLEDYFIEPPFFKAVYGDIHAPKSFIVYAPRGGGKTALKRRIELAARTDAFLCVTYNTFPTTGLKLANIDLEYHLRNLTRILLVAILSAATTTGIDNLSGDDKHFLYMLAKEHLSRLDRSDLKDAISSVKNLSDTAKDVWNTLTGPLSAGLTVALMKFGFKSPELSKFEAEKGMVGNLSEQIAFLARIATLFGFFSTYVLVDKIDENVLTGKASSSLLFVRPLLTDLGLLEAPGIGFKFFLWDRLEADAREFSRPDRVKIYSLKWTSAQLKEMLSRRLAAHSAQRIHSLASITPIDRNINIDELVVTLSGGSPRNIIRICKAIFDEQSEMDANSRTISERALLRGINVIADELAAETVPENVLRDLKKLRRTDFTVTNVYADVFRISQQSGLQKVQLWQDSGAVIKIGTRQTRRGNRPSNVYAVANPLVLKHIFGDLSALDFWEQKLRVCDCGQLVLRDWDSSQNQFCQACEHVFPADEVGPLLAVQEPDGSKG
jgi:hypothetical protein